VSLWSLFRFHRSTELRSIRFSSHQTLFSSHLVRIIYFVIFYPFAYIFRVVACSGYQTIINQFKTDKLSTLKSSIFSVEFTRGSRATCHLKYE
jgi:hypothetical protein